MGFTATYILTFVLMAVFFGTSTGDSLLQNRNYIKPRAWIIPVLASLPLAAIIYIVFVSGGVLVLDSLLVRYQRLN